jgi:hypothetical protein
MALIRATWRHSETDPLTMNELWDELHSVFIDWPDGVTIDEPEV